MIKKNNLSMKELQAQINALKGNTSATPPVTEQENLSEGVAKKGMLSKLASPYFVITSFLLTHLHKLPILSKYFKLINLIYSRTWWLQAFFKFRRYFLMFNSLLALIVAFEFVGISFC